MNASKKAPSARSFPGQHDGETVELVFHQHPIVLRKQIFIGLAVVLAAELPLLLPQFYTAGIKIFVWVLLAVILYWGYHFVGWYYSVYIITNERLVEIKQKGFFNRRVTEFGHDKIQNINYHIKGFQAVLFKFGDITAQTYVGDLVMHTIYRPVQIHEKLVEIVRRANADGQVQPPPRAEAATEA